MEFPYGPRARELDVRILLTLEKTSITSSAFTPVILPSIFDAKLGFKATKQIFSYFYTVARLHTLDCHLTIEAVPELTSDQQKRAIACALAAGAKSAEYKWVMANLEPDVVVTDLDFDRLGEIIRRARTEESTFLAEELARAKIVPQRSVASDIITMNSRVRFLDLESSTEKELTLVYPQDAQLDLQKVSVLAPVGAALLGLKPGSEIEWALPRRAAKRIRVLAVPYQPEAAGDWHL